MAPPIKPGTKPETIGDTTQKSKTTPAAATEGNNKDLENLTAEDWGKMKMREPSGIDIIYAEDKWEMWMCLYCAHTLCPDCDAMRKKRTQRRKGSEIT